MLEESGKFIYKKDGVMIKASVPYFNPFGILLKIYVPIDSEDDYEELLYNKETHQWLWHSRESEDKDVYEEFPYEVIRFEYTTRII